MLIKPVHVRGIPYTKDKEISLEKSCRVVKLVYPIVSHGVLHTISGRKEGWNGGREYFVLSAPTILSIRSRESG